MKGFFAAAATLSVFVASALAMEWGVTENPVYDNVDSSLSGTTCGGQIALSSFQESLPYLASAEGVPCGSCWELTFEGKSINVYVVNQYTPQSTVHSSELPYRGFTVGSQAMYELAGMTDNYGGTYVDSAEAVQVDASACGAPK